LTKPAFLNVCAQISRQGQTDEALGAYLRDKVQSSYHASGTCKMGQDELSVVDPQCRVRGLEGLRVADASIMPIIPSCNLNCPTIMIGEKAADLMRQVLAAANQRARDWDGRMIFVYLPQSKRVNDAAGEALSGEPLSPYYQDVKAVVRELGIPIVDLVPLFETDPEPMSHFPYGLHGHYSEKGNAVVADTVLAMLGTVRAH
jgi:hypothetical protein